MTASNASQRVAIERNALAELIALAPPAGVAAQWKTMIAQTKVALAEVTELAAAARSGNDAVVTKQATASAKVQFLLLAAAANAGVNHCTEVG